jgi:hypothetical protein
MSPVIAQHTSLTIQQIDPCNAENSLEDMAQQQDIFFSTANSFHVKGDDKYNRSVQCIVFMITGGRISSIREITTYKFGLRSKEYIDPVDLRMSCKMWEKRGLVQIMMGKFIEHTQYMELIEYEESMMMMFVNFPAKVITQGVLKSDEEFFKFFYAEYFEEIPEEKHSPSAALMLFRNVSLL